MDYYNLYNPLHPNPHSYTRGPYVPVVVPTPSGWIAIHLPPLVSATITLPLSTLAQTTLVTLLPTPLFAATCPSAARREEEKEIVSIVSTLNLCSVALAQRTMHLGPTGGILGT